MGLRSSWRELAFEKQLSIVVMPLLLAAIGIGVPLLLAGGDGDGGSTTTAAAAARLEVVDLSVRGGRGAPEPRDELLEQIDLTVRNAGDLVAVVTGAQLRVRAFGEVRICQGGSALDPSASYDVLMPGEPRIGQLIDARVSQQIAAGEADRFTLSLDVSPRDRQLGLFLYQLDVLLRTGAGSAPLDAGTVLVSVPRPPTAADFPTAADADALAQPGNEEVRACYERNERTLARMVALDGARGADLVAR